MPNLSRAKNVNGYSNPQCEKDGLRNHISTMAINIKTGTSIAWNSSFVNYAVTFITVVAILILPIQHSRTKNEIPAKDQEMYASHFNS